MKTEALFILAFVLWACLPAQACGDVQEKAQRYIRAYPDFFTSYEGGFLFTRDGRKIPFDDGKEKNCLSMVSDPGVGDDAFDPQDAFSWDYPAGRDLPTAENPPAGDPGRIRPAAVFRYLYGKDGAEQLQKMRSIPWPAGKDGRQRKVTVTTVGGVDRALEKVVREIEDLPPEQKAGIEKVFFGPDGPYGYYDRPVRGFPGRTSGHAYGIAVDINGDLAYFSGSRAGEPYRYRNNVPRLLVDIFEKHGFIWGGRWHFYDAMHFEYRPELLLK